MIIQCPHCGKRVKVNGLGRKRLNIPLKNICETLQSECSVAAAARQLHCSQGYIFNILKSHGLKPRDITERRVEVTNNGYEPGTLFTEFHRDMVYRLRYRWEVHVYALEGDMSDETESSNDR